MRRHPDLTELGGLQDQWSEGADGIGMQAGFGLVEDEEFGRSGREQSHRQAEEAKLAVGELGSREGPPEPRSRQPDSELASRGVVDQHFVSRKGVGYRLVERGCVASFLARFRMARSRRSSRAIG